MPQRYKVQNWKEYNRSLVERGNIIFFIEEKMFDNKKSKNQKYRDGTIIMCHQVKYLLKLGYRQTEGFLRSLAKNGLSSIGETPNYTTMCRRVAQLNLKIQDFRKEELKDGILVAIDSTGVFIYNMSDHRNEACNRLYSGMDRYKKLHIMMDLNSREVIDLELTSTSGAGTGDVSVGNVLTKRMESKASFLVADGAYCCRSLYKTAYLKGIKNVVLPPSKVHKPETMDDPSVNQRNDAINFIRSFASQEEG